MSAAPPGPAAADADPAQRPGRQGGLAAEARAVFRILYEVAAYRLRRLEMANMFAGVTIMFALRLSYTDAAVRLAFAFFLNLLAYLTNDYYDVDQDLTSPNKIPAKARFLRAHLGAARAAMALLWLLLTAAGLLYARGLLLALLLGAGTCWIYSYKLKRVPYVDVVCMILCGLAMPMVGCPLDRPLGWLLLGQLALFCACFESIQVIRDHDEDVAAGVRTTAVRLGVRRTRRLQLALYLTSALYAVTLLHRLIGLALLSTLLVPLDQRRAATHWNRIRMAQGLPWMGITGWIFLRGASQGLLLRLTAAETLAWLRWLR